MMNSKFFATGGYQLLACIMILCLVACASHQNDDGKAMSIAVKTIDIVPGDMLYGEPVARVEVTESEQLVLYANGRRAIERQLCDGVAHGTTKAWYPDGTLRYIQTYTDGLLDGRSTMYDETGRVTSDTTWMAGARVP
jgi:hypothetical protein